MKIYMKLILGFLAVTLLIGVVGYISIDTSQRALEESIGESSVLLAGEIMNKLDGCIHMRIEEFQFYSQLPGVRDVVIESNQEFERLEDIQDYVDKKDREWVSTPEGTITPFVQGLMNNTLSNALRGRMRFYRERYDHEVFSEAFITNKYGANVIQTGKTFDYYQADEEWWQKAKNDGLYVADVEYDRSAGVYSTDICIRIDDENGNFLGVMKVVLNIEGVINTLKKFELGESVEHEAHRHGGYGTLEFKLLTKEGNVIYSTEEFEFLEDVSGELLSHFEKEGEHVPYFIGRGDISGEGDELFAHAHSEGYGSYKGLGWILVVEHETEEIFAPVTEMRSRILILLSILLTLAILFSTLTARSISNPIKKLTETAENISRGNLKVEVEGKERDDEVGALARAFDRTLVSLKLAMKQTAPELRKEKEELKKIIEGKEKAEKKLRLFSQAVECSTDGMAMGDLKGRITYVNKAFTTMFGYSKEELIGREIAFIYSEDQMPKLKEAIKATMEGGWVGELISRRKNGELFQVEISSTTVVDDKGNVIAQMASHRDISKRKQADDDLELRAKLLDNATDSIIVSDLKGNILYVNGECYRSRGYTKEEMLGMNVKELNAPGYSERVKPWIHELMQKGEITIETAHLCKDGSVILLEAHIRVIEVGGKKLLLSVARDITERKKAEGGE